MRPLALWRAHRSALLGIWVYRVVAGLIVAYPLTQALARPITTAFTDGDSRLWAPGGYYLVEALRMGRVGLGGAIESAILVGSLLALLGQIPLAMLVASLAREQARDGDPQPTGKKLLGGFFFFGGFTLLAQVALGLATFALVRASQGPLGRIVDERTADLVSLGLIGIGIVGIIGAGLYEDLARACLTRAPDAPRQALLEALRVFTLRLGRTLVAWGGRSALTLVVLSAAALASDLLGGVRSGPFRLAALAGIHQAAIAAWILLRADWMRRALELSRQPASSRPMPESRAERNAAPDDPSRDRDA
jgi:hypothetical protein